ncbi:MAG: hypothetical protein K0S77_499 [Pseudomonas sp.]|jgi:hypothetical protein|nr:hypothetical protein [Pseudomonas sp.]
MTRPLRWQASSHRYRASLRSPLYLYQFIKDSTDLRAPPYLWELACQRKDQ